MTALELKPNMEVIWFVQNKEFVQLKSTLVVVFKKGLISNQPMENWSQIARKPLKKIKKWMNIKRFNLLRHEINGIPAARSLDCVLQETPIIKEFYKY
jgi:hypothetical protein